MKYLLDTNICMYIIHDRTHSLRRRLRSMRTGDVGISAITLAELSYGLISSEHERSIDTLQRFIAPLIIASYDSSAAGQYGIMLAELRKKGTSVGAMDLLIASHATALGVTLVTNNIRDFRRIPGLRTENWVT